MKITRIYPEEGEFPDCAECSEEFYEEEWEKVNVAYVDGEYHVEFECPECSNPAIATF